MWQTSHSNAGYLVQSVERHISNIEMLDAPAWFFFILFVTEMSKITNLINKADLIIIWVS